MRWWKTAAIASIFLAFFGVVHACRAATQVTLDIRATNDCSALRGVNIGVADTPIIAEQRVGAFLTAAAPQCKPGAREIGTLVVTPGERGRAAVIVVAGVSTEAKECVGPSYAGCVVARRTLSFVEGSSLVVPITIDFACEDVPCNVDTTCKNGECISSELDCNEDGCTPVDPRGRDDVDASASADAARDATSDGSPYDVASPNDAAFDGPGIDGALPPTCPHICPSAGLPPQAWTACPPPDVCCYTDQFPPYCLGSSNCQIGGGSAKSGIAACCGGSNECSGFACCLKVNSKKPTSGVATCTSASMCGGSDVQLCSSATDCSNNSCVLCSQLGFEEIGLKCCAP